MGYVGVTPRLFNQSLATYTIIVFKFDRNLQINDQYFIRTSFYFNCCQK